MAKLVRDKHIPSFKKLVFILFETLSKSGDTFRYTQQKLYSGVQHSLWECKGVWWMPRLYKAMKDVKWLR